MGISEPRTGGVLLFGSSGSGERRRARHAAASQARSRLESVGSTFGDATGVPRMFPGNGPINPQCGPVSPSKDLFKGT